jgi:2OG-Fe(II) oxygenase superfamily
MDTDFGIRLYEDVQLANDKFLEELIHVTTATPNFINWLADTVFLGDLLIKKRSHVTMDYYYPEFDQNNFLRVVQQEMAADFTSTFSDIITEYTRDYGFPVTTFGGYEIIQYEAGDFFMPHIEDNNDRPARLVIEYFLNDDYEGGEVDFIHLGVKVTPKKNSVLIYPASFVHAVQILPVTSGTRYSIMQYIW